MTSITASFKNCLEKPFSSFEPSTRKKIENYSYPLQGVIGKGYSSQVYKGRNDDTSEAVAIKVIDMKMLNNELNKMLLSSQIEILKKLEDAPHILQLKDVFNTKNNTYLITQLCDADLSSRVKKSLCQKQILNYMAQLVQGYRQLYQNQIVHRDLKPANVLIKNNQLKIADFGFAINQRQIQNGIKYNVGSPLYMPPESLKKNQYSYQSDIWALGVICYEMVYSKTPWNAKTQKDLMKKIDTEDISQLIIPGSINRLLQEFIIRSLQHNKLNRLRPRDLCSFQFKKMNIKKQIFISQSMSFLSPLQPRDQNITRDRSNLKSNKLSQNKKPTNLTHLRSIQDQNILNNKSMIVQISRDQRKNISNILLSQIHFCRFLFKFILRLKEHNAVVWEEVICRYSSIVIYKINKLQRFELQNFLNVSYYYQYKRTNDYKRIMKIIKQYSQKYTKQLRLDSIKVIFNIRQSVDVTKKFIRSLHSHLFNQVQRVNIEDLSKQTIILDYLITAYQLFLLIEDGQNYQLFAKKSKIQQIVEGQPTLVTVSHFKRICQKFQDLNI